MCINIAVGQKVARPPTVQYYKNADDFLLFLQLLESLFWNSSGESVGHDAKTPILSRDIQSAIIGNGSIIK